MSSHKGSSNRTNVKYVHSFYATERYKAGEVKRKEIKRGPKLDQEIPTSSSNMSHAHQKQRCAVPKMQVPARYTLIFLFDFVRVLCIFFRHAKRLVWIFFLYKERRGMGGYHSDKQERC